VGSIAALNQLVFTFGRTLQCIAPKNAAAKPLIFHRSETICKMDDFSVLSSEPERLFTPGGKQVAEKNLQLDFRKRKTSYKIIR
jgi:hypothetical protein